MKKKISCFVLFFLFVVLVTTVRPQEEVRSPHPIDWKPCDEIITPELKKKAEDFNARHIHEGLSVMVGCSYGGDPTITRPPEKHVALSVMEKIKINYIRSKSDSAFKEQEEYEKYLIAKHGIKKPDIGNACYYYVGIKFNDDFITVDDGNPFDPSCK
jgi:hypothetical protein